MGEAARPRRWGGASWLWRARLWLMDWLMQDAAKDLLKAEDRTGEGQGGFRGGGPARTDGEAGATAGGAGVHAGTTADKEELGAEVLRGGVKAEGSGSRSCLDALVLEPWRSGFLQAQRRGRVKPARTWAGLRPPQPVSRLCGNFNDQFAVPAAAGAGGGGPAHVEVIC